MKTFHVTVLTALLIIPCCLSAKTLQIASDPWCPYNCSPDSEKPGFVIEVAKIIFEASGYQVEYQILNWTRAKDALNKGDIDAVVGMSRSSTNFDKWVFPNEALGVEQMCLFTHLDGWNYQGVDSLKGKRLGVIHGYGYGDEINPYIDTHRESPSIVTVSGRMPLELLVKMIKANRIDMLIENRFVMGYFLNGSQTPLRLRNAGCVADQNEVFMVFSIHDPEASHYVRLLDQGIKTLRENGKLQEILNRYGVSDWK